MSQFAGKVALVTGGTTGIGRETAIAYARGGAKVVVAGRRESEGNETLRLIREVGGEALFVKTDVSVEEDIIRLVAQTVQTFGRLDIAFNNAGIELFAPLNSISEESYDQVIDINVKGVFFSMKHEIEAMLKTGGGSIVNTSSVAGQAGMGFASVYSASKHAVNGLTRSVAMEFAKRNIRVNAIAPGAVKTEMYDRLIGGSASDMEAQMIAMHPIGRLGTTGEIASAVLFLSSDESSFITGQILAADGGFSTQ